MSDFNTFTGKTVDDAITEACRFFATERDRLEVDILSGGSTGIFGLVGKKKAQIRVRRRIDPAVTAMIENEEIKAKAPDTVRENPDPQPSRPSREEGPDVGQKDGSSRTAQGETTRNARERAPKAREGRRDKPQNNREPQKNREPREPRPERPRRPEPGQPGPQQAKFESVRQSRDDARPAPEHLENDLPEGQDLSPASPELLALAGEIMGRLLAPILEQEPRMEIEGTASRVNVIIEDEEHSGLLIGREGQTLAALQYLANRILARRWESPVRVQINTGEYREKQDDNLRKMAAYLADKARNLGRPQSTKPLSSYHRRVIHMALQGDETIQTRSKGDGPMKRVIILPRRPKPEAQPQ